METKLEWKDVTTYSQSEAPQNRKPRSVEIDIRGFFLLVTRRHPDTENWYYAFIDRNFRKLKNKDFEDAKKEALTVVYQKLKHAINLVDNFIEWRDK